MAALLTWHHNCFHFHDKITPFSTPHHLSITARCNKTKIQDTILTSVIGKVTHFYGDASTNYHTTVILLGVSHLVSASLFAARRWNTSNPTISHARSLVALLSTGVEPWSLNETTARRTDSINSWFCSISYRQHSTIRGESPHFLLGCYPLVQRDDFPIQSITHVVVAGPPELADVNAH